MAEEVKRDAPQEDGKKSESASHPRIDEKQRMRYIGFEVFPGKPKDLFKNDAEKQKWVDEVHQRRSTGEIIRPDCKLLEERVTLKERLIMAVASVVMLAALFLPWYSAFNEVAAGPRPTQSGEPSPAAITDTADTALADSAVLPEDTVAQLGDTLMEPSESELADALEETEDAPVQDEPAVQAQTGGGEEIITGHQFRKRTKKEYEHVTALGAFASFGSISSHIFSGGFILMLTGVIFLVYMLLMIGLPALNLYAIFGVGGDSDARALKMKKLLRFNWLPLLLLVLALFLSFLGADYGAGTAGLYTSFGDSYGVGVLLTTLSWGVIITMAASILVAVKGVEI